MEERKNGRDSPEITSLSGTTANRWTNLGADTGKNEAMGIVWLQWWRDEEGLLSTILLQDCPNVVKLNSKWGLGIL